MKGKTIAQETREQFNFIKREIKNGREDVIPYMSGTCNKGKDSHMWKLKPATMLMR